MRRLDTRTAPRPPSRAEAELLLKKARELAAKAPQKAAMILTDWMNRNARKKAG